MKPAVGRPLRLPSRPSRAVGGYRRRAAPCLETRRTQSGRCIRLLRRDPCGVIELAGFALAIACMALMSQVSCSDMVRRTILALGSYEALDHEDVFSTGTRSSDRARFWLFRKRRPP